MARYRLKRKYYGIAEAAGNTLGGATEAVGKTLDSKPAAVLGGVAGAATVGSTIGDAVSSLGGPLSFLAKPAGYVAGYMGGAAVTRGIGKGLKSAGQDMQT